MGSSRGKKSSIPSTRASPAEERSGYPTLFSACRATPGIMRSVSFPTLQVRCGQAGEGPGKGYNDDQRTGKLSMGGKAETTGFV